MACFYNNFESCTIENEPKIEGTERNPDLKIFFNEEFYYVEICVLMKDQLEEKKEIIESKIQKKIHDLHLPVFISLEIEDSFDDENIDEFIDFVKDLSNHPIKEEYYFSKNNHLLATIFMEMDFKGLAFHGHLRAPNTHRVKKKLESKLEDGQLPINQYNIVVVKLKDMFARQKSTFEKAFYGENSCGNDHKTNRFNGFIHHPQSENISAVIFYKNNFRERKLFLNPNAKKPIDNEFKSKLESL